MTIVVDPAGTPAVTRRDSSTSIYEVAAAGSTGATATLLTIYSMLNVVKVTSDQSGRGIKLPNADEGDYLEVYNVSGHTMAIYDTSNNTLPYTGAARFQARYLGGVWKHTHQ